MKNKHMKRTGVNIFVALAAMLLLGSCATIVNGPTMGMHIEADVDSVKVYMNNDSLNWHALPAEVEVKRSSDNLLITLQKDSIRKQIEVKRKLSDAFWAGNLFTGAGVVGYIIDMTNTRRYTYPRRISIDYDKSTFSAWPQIKVHTHAHAKSSPRLKPQKNLFTLKASLPYGNHIYQNRGRGFDDSFGFFGVSFGAEYYLSDRLSLNMDFGGVLDFPIPFPAAVCSEDSAKSSAGYVDFQVGSDVGWLHYDLGIQLNRSSYYESKTRDGGRGEMETIEYQYVQKNLGLALSAYYRLTNAFNVSLNYYPSFFVLGKNSRFEYTHLLFFEMSLRFEVNRR